MAVEADIFLRRNAGFRRADGITVEDMDLRLDDIDAGDDLGHRVLDLDARIDFDEVEFAAVGIHQILDGTGADIVSRLGNALGIGGKLFALRLR